jgi:hypothetical protein
MNKSPEVVEQLKGGAADTPMGRFAEPEEMVGPASFFPVGPVRLTQASICCWLTVALCAGDKKIFLVPLLIAP